MLRIKKTKQGGEYRAKQGYWYCRNWILFYTRFLPLSEMPNFLFLHLKSFFRNTKGSGSMDKTDCLFGIFHGLFLTPKYIWLRNSVNINTLERIKLDLFPNSGSIYTE